MTPTSIDPVLNAATYLHLTLYEHHRTGYMAERRVKHTMALVRFAEDIDRACLAACPDNTEAVLGNAVNRKPGYRYLLLNENGDRMIKTGHPAAVIAGLHGAWLRICDRYEALDRELHAAQQAIAKLTAARDALRSARTTDDDTETL